MDPDRNPSYWQQGCNDAKAGKPLRHPFTEADTLAPPTGWTRYGMQLANAGYRNGFAHAAPDTPMVIYRRVANPGAHPVQLQDVAIDERLLGEMPPPELPPPFGKKAQRLTRLTLLTLNATYPHMRRL